MNPALFWFLIPIAYWNGFNFFRKYRKKRLEEKRKTIENTASDIHCFHCQHTEHGTKMPNKKQVGEATGKAALGLAVNLARDGNPLITGAKFLANLAPRDRCYNCAENWLSQKTGALQKFDEETTQNGCVLFFAHYGMTMYLFYEVIQKIKYG